MKPEHRSTFGGRKIDTSFNVYWMATFEDYDGAPDSSPCFRLMGTGRTETEAIADLIEQTRELEPAGLQAVVPTEESDAEFAKQIEDMS